MAENVDETSPTRGASFDVGACPSFVAAMDVIGRRWSGLIIEAIGQGNIGFAEISRFIGVIGDTMLARRLRELEDDLLVVREVVDGPPVRVRYSLTERGAELLPILQQIVLWGHAHALAGSRVPEHHFEGAR
ncbi:winged helix-turn-helix transcriptional regulator [Microbacterium sp. P06]|uniref:winged helix-turn-helix transcriptional regulator n=1 Tax=Microbacterium sp. P06 TaxID=3366949 RepID=UPI003746DD0B